MKISKTLNDAINAQIGEELKASNAYANMAAFFNSRGLLRLTEMFFEQSEEEREHAFKFVKYLLEVEGDLSIPAIPAVPAYFDSIKAAFERALSWEKEVTASITHMMDLAVDEKDYAAQDLLQWYINEQVEEEATMSHMMLLAEELEEHSPLMIESHLPK